MTDDIEHLKTNPIEASSPDSQMGTNMPHFGGMTAGDSPDATGGDGTIPIIALPAADVEEAVIGVLRQVFDPEIPVNIYDLGLIYGIEVGAEYMVEVKMTLTAPACPVADSIVREVADKVGGLDCVARSHVTLVWDPPWTPARMTEEAKLELGML